MCQYRESHAVIVILRISRFESRLGVSKNHKHHIIKYHGVKRNVRITIYTKAVVIIIYNKSYTVTFNNNSTL